MHEAPPVHIVAWFPLVSHLSQRQKPHFLSVGMTSMPSRRRVAVDHSDAGIFQFLCCSGGRVTQWWPGPECAKTCVASSSVRVSHLFLSHHCATDSRWPSSERRPVTAYFRHHVRGVVASAGMEYGVPATRRHLAVPRLQRPRQAQYYQWGWRSLQWM